MKQIVVTVRSPKKETIKLIIEPEHCKGCSFCVEFCPKNVLSLTKDQFNAKGYSFSQADHPENCMACGLCEMYCPDFAIYLAPEADEPQPATIQSTPSEETQGEK